MVNAYGKKLDVLVLPQLIGLLIFWSPWFILGTCPKPMIMWERMGSVIFVNNEKAMWKTY